MFMSATPIVHVQIMFNLEWLTEFYAHSIAIEMFVAFS